MKYTNNYHLPQWSEDDLILMEDFNQMNRDIEAGISGNASGVAEAKEVAEKARKTSVAAYSPSNKPYVVGSYMGEGRDKTIDLGFRPSFVICNGPLLYSEESVAYASAFFVATAGNVLPEGITFTDTGFTLHLCQEKGYPKLVMSGRTYDYIAFR